MKISWKDVLDEVAEKSGQPKELCEEALNFYYKYVRKKLSNTKPIHGTLPGVGLLQIKEYYLEQYKKRHLKDDDQEVREFIKRSLEHLDERKKRRAEAVKRRALRKGGNQEE